MSGGDSGGDGDTLGPLPPGKWGSSDGEFPAPWALTLATITDQGFCLTLVNQVHPRQVGTTAIAIIIGYHKGSHPFFLKLHVLGKILAIHGKFSSVRGYKGG